MLRFIWRYEVIYAYYFTENHILFYDFEFIQFMPSS